jgi:hypothetical protein
MGLPMMCKGKEGDGGQWAGFQPLIKWEKGFVDPLFSPDHKQLIY